MLHILATLWSANSNIVTNIISLMLILFMNVPTDKGQKFLLCVCALFQDPHR